MVHNTLQANKGSSRVTSSKEPACQWKRLRDVGSVPGLGRFPEEGHVNPLQYSCLENPMDRGVWWAMVHRVAKSQTRLKWLSTYTQANKWQIQNWDSSLQIFRAKLIFPPCLFFFFPAPWALWDLSSPVTKDQTQALAVKALSPNHWTTRQFPKLLF